MTDPALDSRYSWTRLGLTLALATAGNVGIWAIIVVLPGIQAEFGVDRAEASVPYTLTMVGFALGNLLIGRFVDRFGITLALIGAALCSALGFALAALAPSMALLGVMHMVIGFGTATCFGPLIADISHWFLRRRGIAVAIAASGNYLSGALWPMLLSGLLESGGWRSVYFALSVMLLVLMIPLALTLRRRVPDSASATAAAAAAARAGTTGMSPGTLQTLLAIAGVGCCVAMAMPQVHIVALCTDLSYGSAAGAQMLSLMLLGGVVSRLVFGALSDRLGGLRTLLLGSTLQCAALVMYLPADSLPSLYAVSLLFGLSQGGIVPSYAIIVREYMPAREAGARVGVVIFATIAGMALGGWLSGWMYDLTGSYDAAFLNSIGWNLLNIAIIALILSRARPRAVPA